MKAIKLLIICFILSSKTVRCYETDQYSWLHIELKDSLELLDEVVNDGIKTIATQWSEERNSVKFANKVARLFSTRQLERFINASELIDKKGSKLESIYRTTGILNSPIIRVKGIASTFNLNGVQIGADKMSHFFGVGGILFRLYHRELKSNQDKFTALKKALRHSRFTEVAYWGQLTTNVFSNADLVVNYEGMRFLNILFSKDERTGKQAILRWQGNRPVVQRPFTFSDHVNDFWSEALNPSWFQKTLSPTVLQVLRSYCLQPNYKSIKNIYVSKNENNLRSRYENLLGLKSKAKRFRLDNVCGDFLSWPARKKEAYIIKYKLRGSKYAKKMKDHSVNSDKNITVSQLIEKSNIFCRKNLSYAKMEHEILVELNNAVEDRKFTSISRQYDSFDGRKCFVYDVKDYKKSQFLRDELNLELHYCEGKSVFYRFKLGKKERLSVAKVHGLNDAKAYIYRTIPSICRWY